MHTRATCATVIQVCCSNTPNLKGQRPMQQVPCTTSSKPYLNHFESTRALVAQRGATHQKQKVGLSMRGYKTISHIMDSPPPHSHHTKPWPPFSSYVTKGFEDFFRDFFLSEKLSKENPAVFLIVTMMIRKRQFSSIL